MAGNIRKERMNKSRVMKYVHGNPVDQVKRHSIILHKKKETKNKMMRTRKRYQN